jgi:hypothetical protein
LLHVVALLLILVWSTGLRAAASASENRPTSKEAERLVRAAEVLKEIMGAPDQSLPRELLDRPTASS